VNPLLSLQNQPGISEYPLQDRNSTGAIPEDRQEKFMKRHLTRLFALAACLIVTGCVEQTSQVNKNTVASPSPSATPSTSPSPAAEQAANTQPLTLPVLNAFFADESFAGELKTRLQLSDAQVTKLRELAHAETAKLDEDNAGKREGESSDARSIAAEKISAVIGSDKMRQLAVLVGERWSKAGDEASDKTASQPTNPNNRTGGPNAVPTDSRIVVNAPAYRMDVFDGGRLIKSYKIGIGYPQFPLPTGLRKARVIIVNPTWTPPDSPWVAKMKNVRAGETVEAGSSLNPLGPIKVPIGGPSLIHGGKSPAKIGTFASHGCVGLTTPQVQDFAKVLAQLGGAHLTDADLTDYARDKTQTKQIKLEHAVPVELRYETIVVEDGKLHIYRDVYDQEANTEEKLRAVLEANGVRLADLTDAERTQIADALERMSGKSGAGGVERKALSKESPAPGTSPRSAHSPVEKGSNLSPKATAVVKGQNEIVIEVAALKGKGYPSPVALDTGGRKMRTTVPTAPKRGK
jgi:lipoprotein-anchoring transpeptidase ErfK/SrfK